MKFSKYNILSKIRDSENYFIINILSGSADIIDKSEAARIEGLRTGEVLPGDAFAIELAEKGYIADELQEAALYRRRYLDFLDSREQDEIQIFFVTNYSCNFACSYCYQDQYITINSELSSEVVDAFFSYITGEFSGRRKYITLFGGEPLLNSHKQRELIRNIVRGASESNIELSFVTNGYFLEEYLPLLDGAKIREIQVTLDGTQAMHDHRRFLKGGSGTFDKIVKGIDAALAKGIEINLRMVIDRENIGNLPELAAFAIEKGWTGSSHFKTQIGRNYELHHCQSAPDKLFDRISLYESIYELTKEHPHILEFYKPAYSVSKFLADNGSLPDPLFDACPACKTEWAFDYTGHIFSCTATVGKQDESLGTFYPEVVLNHKLVEEWESRDVTSIEKCRSCSVQLACGGGCGSVAKNRTGNICSDDCRPVKELLEIGFSAWIEKETN